MHMRYPATDADASSGLDAVHITGLTKTFGHRSAATPKGALVAVDEVTIAVPTGQLLVLLGPSGCGKTTLLRCVAGLERPSGGRIVIGGKPVYDDAVQIFVEPEQRGLGMMFQSYALWPHMNVQQNISYVMGTVGRSRQAIATEIRELLASLGVDGLQARYPSELSGGQQQRVALARALIRKPTVLLFDEPLSNVDARVRRRLRAELRSLKEETRFSGIYVTHDQEEAMELADILAVMENGRIVQSGVPRQIYDQPRSLYVADFIGEINRFEGKILRRDGDAVAIGTQFGEIVIGNTIAAPADAGWIGIRPEDIRLAPAPGETAVKVAAQVRECVFLGPRTELRFTIAGQNAHMSIAQRDFVAPAPGTMLDVFLPVGSLKWLVR